MPPTLSDGTQLDPKVVKVMRAIRHVESGGDFNAVGDGGQSNGAYQWNRGGKNGDRWAQDAAETIGDANAQMTPANQNKVAYLKIKKWKDEGLQPDEIAAKWNGAKRDPATGRLTYVAPEYGRKFREALGVVTGAGRAQAASAPGYAAPVRPETPKPAPATAQAASVPARGESLSDTLQSNEGDGLLKRAAKAAGRFALDVTRPVAKGLTAVPQAAAQLGATLGGTPLSDEELSKVGIPGLRKIYGDIAPAKTVKEAVGAGVQTAALGLAPVTGGALYAAGRAAEEGKGAARIAGEGLLGGALGKVASVAAPLVGHAVGKAVRAVPFAGRLIDAASGAASRASEAAGKKVGAAFPTKVPGVQAAADWLNAAPGKTWRAAYGTGGVPEIDKALGVTAAEAKSAGAMRGLTDRRREGLEVLSDMTDHFQVKGADGELVPYRPHDPATTFAMDADALAQGKQEIWKALESAASASGGKGVRVDTSGISSKLRAEASRVTASPDARARALQIADQLDAVAAAGENTPSGMQEMVTGLNTRLRGVLSGGSASEGARVDADAASALAEALDEAVVAAGGAGKSVPFLRKKYAALKSVESAMLRQARSMANRAPGSGLQDYINPFNVADALGFLVEPVGAAKGVIRAGIGKLMTNAKDKNALMRSIFKNLAAARGIPTGPGASALLKSVSSGVGGASAGPAAGLLGPLLPR